MALAASRQMHSGKSPNLSDTQRWDKHLRSKHIVRMRTV